MATWVIPDIHGCYYTLRELLQKAGPVTGDTLVFLGDYIDRGPYSREVMDFVKSLDNAISLMGNHEEVLESLQQNTRPPFWQRWRKKSSDREKDWLLYGGDMTLQSFGLSSAVDFPDEYIRWIRSLLRYYKDSQFYYVHAGFNFRNTDILEDQKAMLWIREIHPDPVRLEGRKIIRGHVPTSLNSIRYMLDDPHSIVYSLDNGCVYKHMPGLGNLLALNIDTWELVVQGNID